MISLRNTLIANTADINGNFDLKSVHTGGCELQITTLMVQPEHGEEDQSVYFALQYHHSDGPFESPEKYERMNLYGKYSSQLTPNSRLTVSADGFTTGWNTSGKIPERAIRTGHISRFGGTDNLEGGVTNHKNVQLNYHF
jgi:hypothetical protein